MNKIKSFFSNVWGKITYFFRNLFKANDRNEAYLVTFKKNEGTKSVFASIISILIGIFFGFIIMLILGIFNPKNTVGDAFKGLGILFRGPFASASKYIGTNFGNMLFNAVPLIFTGLSVAIAYKTGLFNIGAAGQFIMGGLGSLLIALNINTTGNRFAGVMVWILAVIAGVILATIWGMIPGIFKAFFGINEVIVCIMTNWIAANIFTWVFDGINSIHDVGAGASAYLIKTSVTGNFTPKLGLDKLFNGSMLDMSLIIAIVVAIVIYIILNKTVFGYELKACGSNKDASKYAGMNAKRNIILSMAIAGALTGLGACFYYLNSSVSVQYKSMYQNLPAYGFNGIPAALLANCNPIGVIFSAIFIRYLTSAGSLLASAGYNKYLADIVIAFIIYLAGFARLFKELLNKRKKNEKVVDTRFAPEEKELNKQSTDKEEEKKQ